MGAAGTSTADPTIEDVFSTYLYTGTGSAQTITNDIDLDGEGGLVWIKNRDALDSHILTDTVRGATKVLVSDDTLVEATDADTITSFTSTGFVLGDDDKVNTSSESYAAWTFRKAPNFFDVVTYTGTGSARTISHSINGTVGMIIVKNLSQSDSWAVYHRGMDDSAPQNYDMHIDTNAARSDDATWNDTAPTSSVFSVGTDHMVNADGENYVAYLFAHDTESDSMIKCDKFLPGEGSLANGEMDVDLGFEPQFVMIKNRQSADSWIVFDTMRGYTVDQDGLRIRWDTNAGEAAEASGGHPNATGFATDGDGPLNNHTHIYMAIRRPNMATITDATEVFAMDGENDTAPAPPTYNSGFPVDFSLMRRNISGTENWYAYDRVRGGLASLIPNLTDAEGAAGGTYNSFDNNTGIGSYTGTVYANAFGWMWKRAKSYFDCVAFLGTGSALNVSHGLGVVPEMMWIKNRDVADPWAVYYGDNTDYLVLDTTAATVDDAAWWNDTSPTSSVFTVNTDHSVNASGENYIAYLFATLAGVSKVGSVTHSGTSTDVACGFSAGARFVMLKRTDATGEWYIWDSVRGIVAGNDPYLIMDTPAQVTDTDYIDPLTGGFQISGDFTDGDYIFYAIA